MFLGSYDPSKSIVTLGSYSITGLAEAFIEAAYDSDLYKKVVDTDGVVTRVKSSSQSGYVKVTILAGSASNDDLSGLFLSNEPFDLSVTNLSGRTEVQGRSCWIRSIPDLKMAKEMGEVEWVIDCASLSIGHGGTINNTDLLSIFGG